MFYIDTYKSEIYLYIIGKFAVFHSDIECAYYGLKATR